MTPHLPPHNGFASEAELGKARALLALAQQSERVRASLRGLDALCEAIDMPLSIEPRGVVFSPCQPAELDQGLSGFLGKYLMRLAQNAPARPELPHPTPIAPTPTPLEDPELRAASPAVFAPEKNKPAPAHQAAPPQGSNGAIFDDEDFDGNDFDPDSEDFDCETPSGAQPANAPGPRPEELPPPPPMTMAEIKSMMSTAASLERSVDRFGAALSKLAAQAVAASPQRQAFSKRASWDAWGGQAKRSARAAALSAGLLHEHEPAGAGGRALATFCIDPGPLPIFGSEAAHSDPDLERLVLERLRSALDSVEIRAHPYPAQALMLCGWGARAAIAEAEARARGWPTQTLD